MSKSEGHNLNQNQSKLFSGEARKRASSFLDLNVLIF
jgi:hypothetical protein